MLTPENIIFIESVDSTNSYALNLAEKGYPHGTVVVADEQTKGRGRHGRVWYGTKGKDIYMSIILRPPLNEDISLLNLLSAISVAEEVQQIVPVPVRVKWPNDLMVLESNRFKKFGGILSEARFSGKDILFAVVGIGINLNSCKEGLPPDIIDSATTLFSATKQYINRDTLLEGLLGRFKKGYNLFLHHERKRRIIKRWKELSLTTGKDVMAITGQNIIKGRAIDIDERGNLLLKLSSGEIKVVNAGEVIHLRDEEYISR